MDYQLQSLQSKHLRVMDLVLAGKSHVLIAKELKLTPVGVRLIVNAPVFQSRLSREREKRGTSELDRADAKDMTAKGMLAFAAVEAARTQIALLGSSSERISQLSAMDILDRAGVPKISREDHRSLTAIVVLSDSALQRMQQVTEAVFEKPLELPLLSEAAESASKEN